MAFGAISSAKDVCLVMVKTMENMAGSNNPETLDPNTYGTTQAIKDGMRAAGAMAIDTSMNKGIPASGASSENRLRIKYRTKRCNDALTFEADPCVDGSNGMNTWLYGDLTFGDPVYHEFTIDMATMRQICEGRDQVYMDLLLETFQTINRKRNARYITQLGANTGKYFAEDCADAVAVTDYQAPVGFFDSNGQPKPMGLFKITETYNRFGFGGQPRIIGGTPINGYKFSQSIYQGNVAGFDSTRKPTDNMYYDPQVNSVLANGNENILTFANGAAHAVDWFMFDSPEFRYASPTLVKRTMDLGVFFGYPPGHTKVDHTVYFQECGAGDVKIIHKFWCYTELFMLTSDMLEADCGQCSNSILLWDHDCTDPGCNDIDPVIVNPAP